MWPQSGDAPTNEFYTEGYIACAFPTPPSVTVRPKPKNISFKCLLTRHACNCIHCCIAWYVCISHAFILCKLHHTSHLPSISTYQYGITLCVGCAVIESLRVNGVHSHSCAVIVLRPLSAFVTCNIYWVSTSPKTT